MTRGVRPARSRQACAEQILPDCRGRGGQGRVRRLQLSDSRPRIWRVPSRTVALKLSNRPSTRFPVRDRQRRLRHQRGTTSHEMEWHMKRLCHRCGVVSDWLDPSRSRAIRPEPDWTWVLLWRENQRHRPPSKG